MLEIRTYPEPVLRRRTQPVQRIDRELLTLVSDMLETMYAEDGIGLAAPQIGESIRLCVLNVTGDADGELVLINPVVVDQSEEEVAEEEGCLSLPGVRADVLRPVRVKVNAYDQRGQEINIDAGGLESRCLQHEIDHLDGRMFIDRLNHAKQMLLRPQLKQLEKEFAG